MKSSHLAKKLSAYSLVAGAFIIAKQADAQIVYTDVIPDFTLDLGPFPLDSIYPLDLDNNGQVDFEFSVHLVTWTETWGFGRMYLLWGENVLPNEFAGSSQFRIYALSQDDTISNEVNWKVYSGGLLGVYSWSSQSPWGVDTFQNGYWINQPNAFIALRLANNGDSLYGWIRMDVDIHDHLIIKDYAYNTIPNEPILAGDMGFPLSQQNISSEELIISPNPTSSQIIIHKPIAQPSTLTITNTYGIIAKQLTLAANSGSTIIPVDDLPAGVYLVTLSDGERRIARKLIISRSEF